MKRLISFILAVVLLLSLSCSAFAWSKAPTSSQYWSLSSTYSGNLNGFKSRIDTAKCFTGASKLYIDLTGIYIMKDTDYNASKVDASVQTCYWYTTDNSWRAGTVVTKTVPSTYVKNTAGNYVVKKATVSYSIKTTSTTTYFVRVDKSGSKLSMYGYIKVDDSTI